MDGKNNAQYKQRSRNVQKQPKNLQIVTEEAEGWRMGREEEKKMESKRSDLDGGVEDPKFT